MCARPLFRDFAALVFLAVVSALHPATAGTWTYTTAMKNMLDFEGVILPGDDLRLAEMTKDEAPIYIGVDSEGGDIETGMRIGEILRKKEAYVTVRRCNSACVFIYAGAAYREPPTRRPLVGVHRIFLGDLSADLTPEQVKERYDTILAHIRQYLQRMNIAPEFLSFMQSFEPNEMHILTKAELKRFGFGEIDPIQAERNIAWKAKRIGVASFELRSRYARIQKECDDIRGATTEQTGRMYDKCKATILYDISPETYLKRRAQLDAIFDRCVKLGKHIDVDDGDDFTIGHGIPVKCVSD